MSAHSVIDEAVRAARSVEHLWDLTEHERHQLRLRGYFLKNPERPQYVDYRGSLQGPFWPAIKVYPRVGERDFVDEAGVVWRIDPDYECVLRGDASNWLDDDEQVGTCFKVCGGLVGGKPTRRGWRGGRFCSKHDRLYKLRYHSDGTLRSKFEEWCEADCVGPRGCTRAPTRMTRDGRPRSRFTRDGSDPVKRFYDSGSSYIMGDRY